MLISDFLGYATILFSFTAFLATIRVYTVANAIDDLAFSYCLLCLVTMLFGLATAFHIEADIILYPIRIVILLLITYDGFTLEKE